MPGAEATPVVTASCATCGPRVQWSDRAVGVFLWFPGELEPEHVRVGDDVHVCLGCDAVVQLFDQVAARVPPRLVRWHFAIAVFRDRVTAGGDNPASEQVGQA